MGKWHAILLLAIILIIGGVLWTVYFFNNSPHPVACTQEAKQCPDGSYVGRTGPDCAFAACPPPLQEKGNGVLQGTMTIGPICPVEQVGHPCNPTPQMYAAHTVFVYSSDRSKLITTLIPDANGNFSATLPTGTYFIDIQHQSIGGVRGVPTTLIITTGQVSTVAISIDTGIR